MRQQIEDLAKERDHKWKNIYLVVKDNRIFRRQNAKLKYKFREQAFLIQRLESELTDYKRQNMKLKFLIQNTTNDGEGPMS